MLHTETIPEKAIITATIDGGYTAEQIEEFRARVRQITAGGATPRFLMAFEGLDLGKVSARAAWDDLNASELFTEADRIAILADQDWIGNLGELVDAVSHLQVQTFATGHREQALAWLTR